MAYTACIHGKSALFASVNVVDAFCNSLHRACDRHECATLVYCFMPDHLHVVLRGRSTSADSWKAVTLFKQLSGHWLAAHQPAFRWQNGFYDHIVREENELRRQLRYIAENPIRRGLARGWDDYPFIGSDFFDLRKLFSVEADPA